MAKSSGRIVELDGLRGIAIGTVLVYHYAALEGVNALLRELPGVWRVERWVAIDQFGWIGVDIFFALSGFLIGGILLDAKGKEGFFRVFYVRRALRILPAYVVLCAVAVGLWHLSLLRESSTYAWLYEDRLPWYAYANFTQNIWMAVRHTMSSRVIDATWSLAIEEQFYLVLPLLVYLTPRRAIPWIVVGGMFAAPLLRLTNFVFFASDWTGRANYLLTHTRMDALLIGVLVAYGWREHRAALEKKRTFFAISGVVITGMVVFMAAAGWNFSTGNLMTWGLSVIACWCGSLVLLALLFPATVYGGFLRQTWLRALGTVAYFVYLFHQPVLGITHWILRGAVPTLNSFGAIATTAVALSVTLAFARLSWRFMEEPLIQFGHRSRYSEAKTRADGSAVAGVA